MSCARCDNSSPCRACAAEARVSELEAALQKVSDIRDSIVGMQGFNFSEHAYPLVEVLETAGFRGKGYEISRKNLGTLIEQTKKAERERDDAREEAARLRAALDVATEDLRAARKAQAAWSDVASDYLRQLMALRDERDATVAERDALANDLHAFGEVAKNAAMATPDRALRAVLQRAQKMAQAVAAAPSASLEAVLRIHAANEREACAVHAAREMVALGLDEDDALEVRDSIRARGGR